MSTTTPLKAARVWAKQHPDQNAILHVISLTKGGRGGWLTKRHDTNVYITGGLAALTRSRYIFGQILYGRYHNGQCQICGNIYLDLVLRSAFAPDPLAGELIRPRHAWETRDTRRADLAYIRSACPDCITLHSLIISKDSGFHFTEDCNYQPRLHPTLVRFAYVAPTHRLDLRQDNPQVVALEQITLTETAPAELQPPECICDRQGPDGGLACYCEAHPGQQRSVVAALA